MRASLMPLLMALCAGLLLTSCKEDPVASVPQPQELTREAIGHYCNMIVLDHQGPKGQVFVEGAEQPVWFTSVRDTIAFTMLPDEPKNLAAVYVTDVGKASWDAPEPGTWIEAREAWYVVGSDRVGGMGAPEAVPFGEQARAESFAAEHGGHVVAFADIPEDAILGDGGGHGGEEGMQMGHGEHGAGHDTGHDGGHDKPEQKAHDHNAQGHGSQ